MKKHGKKKGRQVISQRTIRMEAPPDYSELMPEEPELTAIEEFGIGVGAMSIDSILSQLASMKDNAESFLEPDPTDPEGQEIWKSDIAACEAATAILSALQDEGIRDPDEVRDMIHDYRAQAKQCRTMHQKYEVGAKAERLGFKFVCPECHQEIVARNKSQHCWFCGKRLEWR